MPLPFDMRAFLLLLLFAGLSQTSIAQDTTPEAWRNALTLYASFDNAWEADVAEGDPRLYIAPSLGAMEEAVVVTADNDLVERATGKGQQGDALQFHSDWDPVFFFKVPANVAYQETDWAGTFSFWLRIDPENGLAPGYSDPFIITDKNWDNASFYVDFTMEDQPRHFRFAAFADKNIWNPDGLRWDAIAPEDRPMIDLSTHPFSGDSWTHVVLTFESFNTGNATGQMVGYLNGEQVGTLADRLQTISWNPAQTMMMLGRHYNGLFDELAVFNRALTEKEVRTLYQKGVRQLIAHE